MTSVSMPPIRHLNYGVNIGANAGPPITTVNGTVIPISPVELLPGLKSAKTIQNYATLDNLLVDVEGNVEQKYGDTAWTPDMKSFVSSIIGKMGAGDFAIFGSMAGIAQKAYAEQNGILISNLMFNMVEQNFASRWSFLHEKEGVMSRDPYAPPPGAVMKKGIIFGGVAILVVAAIIFGVVAVTKGKRKKG